MKVNNFDFVGGLILADKETFDALEAEMQRRATEAAEPREAVLAAHDAELRKKVERETLERVKKCRPDLPGYAGDGVRCWQVAIEREFTKDSAPGESGKEQAE